MKFAFVNSFCGYGSTGSEVLRRKKMFESWGHTVKVFYGINEQKGLDDNCIFFSNKWLYKIENRISMLTGLSGMLSFIPTFRLIKRLKRFKPDIVWLSNIHGNYVNEYKLLIFLKKTNIITVWGLPDEYAFLGKCCSAYDCDKYKVEPGCYKCKHLKDYPVSKIFDNSKLKFNLKRKAYQGFNNLYLISAPYLINKARESILLKKAHGCPSDSSVDVTNIFYPRNGQQLKKKLGIDDNEVVVLCCAPYRDPLKGVKYFVEAASLCKDDKIVFISVGFGNDDIKTPKNFIKIPYEHNKDAMAEYYSIADTYVCTSISDAQPNTCLEALGCGTPILGFNTSGVPYIAEEPFGIFIDDISSDALANAIKKVTKKNDSIILNCREYAKKRFSIEASQKCIKSFLEMLEDRINTKIK